ncbi:Long-chain-fatty-acid--CoA ligase FadD13 [Anoxybacillus sp. BCO1]|nr:Long-chain-fatty-acid--CoA ligase FadD13 [Anoxybacillus sp. BCO1]
MNISELLARNARKFLNKTALIDGDVSLSYQEVDDTVNRLASSLASLGITQGDKVVLYMPNTKEFLYAYFAVLRLGAITVPVNARLTAQEVQYIIEHSEAKAVIAHDWIYEELASLVHTVDVIWVKTGETTDGWRSLTQLIANGHTFPIVCSLNEDDEATILYTSGTTGRPKGVLFTYRNILAVATMMALETKMDKHSRLLHMMPLSHSAPLHFIFCRRHVRRGHPCVISNIFPRSIATTDHETRNYPLFRSTSCLFTHGTTSASSRIRFIVRPILDVWRRTAISKGSTICRQTVSHQSTHVFIRTNGSRSERDVFIARRTRDKGRERGQRCCSSL